VVQRQSPAEIGFLDANQGHDQAESDTACGLIQSRAKLFGSKCCDGMVGDASAAEPCRTWKCIIESFAARAETILSGT